MISAVRGSDIGKGYIKPKKVETQKYVDVIRSFEPK